MKKIFVIFAACLFTASVNAQSLGSIFNTVSKAVYAFTGNTTAVSLPGNWTYTGSAIELGGGNTLSNLAGTAVSSTAQGKVDEYLQKVGIKPGIIKFTFSDDLTFVCTVLGVPINGTWKTSEDGSSVTLQYGRTMKYLSMTGSLRQTMNGCEILFNGKKFLTFIKSALDVVAKYSSEFAGTISSLAGNYSDMKIGFALSRD